MTTAGFLVELKTVSNQFDWTLDPDAGRHAERRSQPRLHLKASLKGSPSAVFDLLGVVCYAKTGKALEARSWPESARALGLPMPDAAHLLAAANDRTWDDHEDGTRKPVPDMISLRAQILDATGVLLRRTAGV